MVMLASDANNPQFVGASNPDAALVVRFHKKAVQNMFESSARGRPIFNDVDYIEIFTPGNQLNIIDTPVREEHKRRFPQQWAHYQNAHSGDQREIGTPLGQWAFLTASQAEELKALKFFTVEALANASDGMLQPIGMIGGMNPMVLRQRALAYLHAAAGTAVQEHEAAKSAELEQIIKDLQMQVAALSAGQPASEAKPKRKLSDEHLAKLKAGREAKKSATQEASP
jgi:hypothetical protein